MVNFFNALLFRESCVELPFSLLAGSHVEKFGMQIEIFARYNCEYKCTNALVEMAHMHVNYKVNKNRLCIYAYSVHPKNTTVEKLILRLCISSISIANLQFIGLQGCFQQPATIQSNIREHCLPFDMISGRFVYLLSFHYLSFLI